MDKRLEWLKYTFTEEEKKKISEELAQGVVQKESLELKKKDVVSQIKSEIDAIESRVHTLSRNINQGYEFRNVECEEIKDYETRKVKIYRLDTDEYVRDRNMTPDELQMEFNEKTTDDAELDEDDA